MVCRSLRASTGDKLARVTDRIRSLEETLILGLQTCRCAQVDLHYNGFCNSVLWQLFHYVPLNTDTKLSETRTLQFQWNAYQDANRHAPIGQRLADQEDAKGSRLDSVRGPDLG